jgi:hypothetical protein
MDPQVTIGAGALYVAQWRRLIQTDKWYPMNSEEPKPSALGNQKEEILHQPVKLSNRIKSCRKNAVGQRERWSPAMDEQRSCTIQCSYGISLYTVPYCGVRVAALLCLAACSSLYFQSNRVISNNAYANHPYVGGYDIVFVMTFSV